MKFSFIQGCKKKFFQRRNICAQIGYNNRVCVCGGVCTCRERKYVGYMSYHFGYKHFSHSRNFEREDKGERHRKVGRGLPCWSSS